MLQTLIIATEGIKSYTLEIMLYDKNNTRQKCKTKIIGSIPADKNRLGQEVCFHIKISE